MAGRGSIAPYMALCRLDRTDRITVVITLPWVLIVSLTRTQRPLSVLGTLIPQLIPDDKRDTVALHKTLRGRDVRVNPAAQQVYMPELRTMLNE